VRRGRFLTTACLAAIALVPVVHPAGAARERCGAAMHAGSTADCFSGAYYGDGFLPSDETMSFRRISATQLRSHEFWQPWRTEARRYRSGEPCQNPNAVMYKGTFSFYGGGSFIACSQSVSSRLSGFFRVKARYYFADDSSTATLTEGPFSALRTTNVVELVFSDARHRNYSQVDVIFGTWKP
jgi:hypothetical protein